MSLGEDDCAAFACQVGSQGNTVVFTDGGFSKQSRIDEYEPKNRNGRGTKCMQWTKNEQNGSRIAGAFYIEGTAAFEAVTELDQVYATDSGRIPFEPRASGGRQVFPVMQGERILSVYKV
jgi:DNA gyrase/topoisomerase IV subunit A